MKNLTNLLIGAGLISNLLFNSCNYEKKDSLMKKTITNSDSAKIDSMNDLAWNLKDDNPKSSLEFLDSNLINSEKINYKKGYADALIRRGAINYSQGNYELAKKDHLEYLEIKIAEKDSIGIADGFNNIAQVFYSQGNYNQAIENYTNALKIYDKLTDSLGISNTYNNLGLVFDSQKNYEKASEYYNKSLEIREGIKDSLGISQTLNNIGLISEKQNKNNEALKDYFNSLEIANKINNKFQQSICFNNIGDVYKKQKDFDKAFTYLQKSMEIKREIGDKEGLARNLINMGEIYKEKQSFSQSLKNLNKSIEIAQEINNPDLLKDIYESLFKIYETKGDIVQAFNYYKDYTQIKDSLSGIEKSKQTAEIETKYQTEKKEQENKLLHKEKEVQEIKINEQTKRIWIFGGTTGLVSLLSAGLYKLYRTNKKAKETIEKQKLIVEEQKAIVDEKNKEITDSINYAKNIQTSILPRDEEFKRALPESFVLYKPKDIVSGDFYWLNEKNNLIFFSASDCTGHGVPGAFMSMLNSRLLNEAVNEKNIEKPNEIFNYIRKNIIDTLKSTSKIGEQKDGMDSVLCSLDKNSNTLEFACANNPLYLIRNNELIEYKEDKMPVGYSEKLKDFSLNKITLQKNDVIYISSDGYKSQFGGKEGKTFKSKNLKELLLSINEKPMVEQKEILDHEFNKYKGNLEQVDDILVIGFRA